MYRSAFAIILFFLCAFRASAEPYETDLTFAAAEQFAVVEQEVRAYALSPDLPLGLGLSEIGAQKFIDAVLSRPDAEAYFERYATAFRYAARRFTALMPGLGLSKRGAMIFAARVAAMAEGERFLARHKRALKTAMANSHGGGFGSSRERALAYAEVRAARER